ERGFIKLHRMAINAIAKIDAPWKRRGDAVGLIAQACKKASDAADRNSQGERNRKEVTCTARDATSPLHPFDTDNAAEQSADDRFTGKQIEKIVPMSQCRGWILEPIEELAAERRTRDGAGDDPDTIDPREEIALLAALIQVELEA